MTKGSSRKGKWSKNYSKKKKVDVSKYINANSPVNRFFLEVLLQIPPQIIFSKIPFLPKLIRFTAIVTILFLRGSLSLSELIEVSQSTQPPQEFNERELPEGVISHSSFQSSLSPNIPETKFIQGDSLRSFHDRNTKHSLIVPEPRLQSASDTPTGQPSMQPSFQPTTHPTSQPSCSPSSQPTSYISGSLNQGLLAFWPFDGNAQDESGNGNHGTVHNALLTTDRFSNVNHAYYFDGSSAYIEILNGNRFNIGNSFSFSIWIKLGVSLVADILSKYVSDTGWLIETADANINTFGFTYFTAPSVYFAACTSIQLTTGKWRHLVVTKNDVTTRCYLDAQLIGLGNASTSATTMNNNLPLLIGAKNGANTLPASGAYRFFNGALDDIFLFNRSLTSQEIFKLYQFDSPTNQPSSQPSSQPTKKPSSQPSSQPTRKPSSQPSSQPTRQPSSLISGSLTQGLVAYYPFDGNARDQSGNGHNGIVNKASLTTDRFGNPNSAYSFNGIDSYIQIPNGSPFDLPNNMSIALWVKPAGTQARYAHILFRPSWSSTARYTSFKLNYLQLYSPGALHCCNRK